MSVPPGVTIPATFTEKRPICKLIKSLYGLRQAPREWFTTFSEALLEYGFTQSKADSSLFILHLSSSFTAILVYVDDIILTGSSSAQLITVKNSLASKFNLKNLGHLNYFLGIEIARSASGIYIHQRKYALNLLANTGLLAAKPGKIAMEAQHNLSTTSSSPLSDGTSYKRLIGQLIYLTITRPDLTYPVHILSQFMTKPTNLHWEAALKLVKYIKAAPGQGLLLSANSPLTLKLYSDADWATCSMTRRSVSGFCVFLGNSLISWKCKKQNTVTR